MSKIRIKNFGPIKEGCQENDGWMDIKKVTVFIGNQGSGKSTVAKLISTFTWIEKAINRGDMDGLSNALFKLFSKYIGIFEYFRSNTEIEFWGERYNIRYSENEIFSIREEVLNGKYITPKIMYIPAERNTLSSISNIKGMPDHLLAFYEEFKKAQKELNGRMLELPINNYDYEYDDITDSSFVVGPDYKLHLMYASSGVQSFIPLYLVTRSLSQLVTQSDEILRKNMKADSILGMNEKMAALEVNDAISESDKIVKRKEIRAKYLSKCFVNIVEEPEQNLFPTSQKNMLFSLLEFNNLSEGNKLIMTTHSPYIINYLSIAIQGDCLLQKIKKSHGNLNDTAVKDNLENSTFENRLNELVPVKSIVASDDVVIYELDEIKGIIKKLSSYEGIPSDKNYLNKSLADGNRLFDALLEIEEDL